MISYEYIEELVENVENNNIQKCMYLILEMYNKFPKEEDCITSIILQEMTECQLVNFLKKYLNKLKNTSK